LVVLKPDRTPVTNAVVTTQESGWRHILPLLMWYDPSWVVTHGPKTHIPDTNGVCHIRFGDEMLHLVSVSCDGLTVTNYVVIQDHWWATWATESDRRRKTEHPSWHRAYEPNTQRLLGHRAELILNQ
jgi:hypothetical protein